MEKYIMGRYTSIAEAQDRVDELMREGYPKDSISVMADQNIVTDLGGLGVAVEDSYAYESADEGTWDRIKGFFQGEHATHTMAAHKQELKNGVIFVFVDKAAQAASTPTANTASAAAAAGDDETFRLQEERLNVDKENIQTGEVTLKKHVVEETRSMDVPVEREELVIEREPVSGMAAGSDDFGDDTITIPLMEEQVHITKEPVVTEEIHVKKRHVTDTKHVSASVRKEEMDIDKAGNAVVEGMNAAQSATTAAPM